jgi:hypothetical protein
MSNNTHTLITATVVSTSGCRRMSWVFHMCLFIMVTSREEEEEPEHCHNYCSCTISPPFKINIIIHVNIKNIV